MTIRWEQRNGDEIAFAGKHKIGAIMPVVGGPSDGKVFWHLDIKQGCCDSIVEAKRDLREAWLTWLRERCLAEVS